MRQLLLICTAALFTLAVVTTAGGANQFAAGSAKTETALTIANLGEHASFDVHSVSGPGFCPASGQMVYKADASPFASGGPLQFQAKLDQLRIEHSGTTAFATFAGQITSVKQGPQSIVGNDVLVDIVDSGIDGGTGDQFLLDQITTPGTEFCEPPITGHPIDQGNIVIKTTP